MRLFVLVSVVCAACGPTLATDNFGKPFQPWIPQDVRAFVIDAQACKHFSGEYGFDPERQEFLERQMQQHCGDIEGRKRVLLEQHQSPRVRQAISKAWE